MVSKIKNRCEVKHNNAKTQSVNFDGNLKRKKVFQAKSLKGSLSIYQSLTSHPDSMLESDRNVCGRETAAADANESKNSHSLRPRLQTCVSSKDKSFFTLV